MTPSSGSVGAKTGHSERLVTLRWWRGFGPPILFETMVFGGPLNEEQVRYVTWDEAERGHAEMVARVRAAIGSPLITGGIE